MSLRHCKSLHPPLQHEIRRLLMRGQSPSFVLVHEKSGAETVPFANFLNNEFGCEMQASQMFSRMAVEWHSDDETLRHVSAQLTLKAIDQAARDGIQHLKERKEKGLPKTRTASARALKAIAIGRQKGLRQQLADEKLRARARDAGLQKTLSGAKL